MDASIPDQSIIPDTSPEPNGCTLWPDVWFGQNIGPCCDAHDTSYTNAQTLTQKVLADKDLALCVADTSGSPLLATAMFLGVVLLGGVFWLKARKKTQIGK